jgi:purine-nucleoside/S-methyl-5'-thioadenosine phosphorylase / adenosine deaminase
MTLPVVSDPFYWTDESWGPALHCRAIDAIAPGLFTTRTLQLSAASDWAQLAESVDASAVVSLTQVHGNRAVIVRRGRPLPVERPEADILVSDHPEVAIAVRAADCVPLLLADSRTGAVAAVHAGWRGTAAAAARVAVETLRTEFGVDPADVTAAIGPSIGTCCYEVGTDLVDAFAAAGHPRDLIDRWFLARPPEHGSRDLPRLRFDVAGANRDQLILAGVQEEHIHMSGLCTAMHLDVLTSFRAEKDRAGRLGGVIRARG